jgi:hypothetical protein
MKEPTYRIENGRKIYSMECRIDAVRRPETEVPAAAPDKTGDTVGARHVSSEERAANRPPLQEDMEDAHVAITRNAATLGGPSDDVVRVRMRLISAVDAFPSMGWLGPQRVAYGHNQAAAIRDIPALIESRPRPVPLMWNHSSDMKDKAGRVVNAEWEESTDIPPGVNAWAEVNWNYDSKAAFGLASGEIDATSVAIWTEMERSHPDMPFEQFTELAAAGGEYEGRMVEWFPTKLLDVPHHAMVPAGADPNSGPREPSHIVGNAALAATNITQRGGITMEHKAITILDSLCRDLGFDVILQEDIPIPEDLAARMAKRVAADQAAAAKYGELVKELFRLGERHLPEKIGSPVEILVALEPLLETAALGATYVNDLRQQALRAFDTAKVDPTREQTLEVRTLRSVIEGSADIGQLKAWISEYEPHAAAKLGPVKRSSQGEELPPVTGSSSTLELTADDRRIIAGVNRWMSGGK